MKKALLLRMKKMNATPTMMKTAEQDEAKYRGGYLSGDTKGYRFGRYIRSTIQWGILKVSIYLPEFMKAGGKLPVYEVYVDKENEKFLTYDCFRKKWLTAKLDNLYWPRYVYYSYDYFCSEGTYMQIKRYLDTKQGGYAGLFEYQLKVRADELKRKHRRETDPWDLELSQTKPLPEDWNQWIRKVGIPHYFIFYNYVKRGAKTGYCSYCEKEVPIKEPRHNKVGKCPKCGHEIPFKAIGRMGTFYTPTVPMYLIQRCDTGFMVREFLGHCSYYRGEYMNPHYSTWEVRRALFDKNGKSVSAYNWGVYKQQHARWIKNNVCYPRSIKYYWEKGKIYGKSLPVLFKDELKVTGLQEHIQKNPVTDPEMYLAFYKAVPLLEKLVKADMSDMVTEFFSNPSDYINYFQNNEEPSLIKALGIDGPRLKRLRDSGRGLEYLRWLRFDKASGQQLSDPVIFWFCNEQIKPKDLDFISDRMNMVQIYNYIRRQMVENKESSKWVLTTWSDYLSMATKLGMDTTDDIIYRVRKLRQRHQELVDRINQMDDETRAKELESNFPNVQTICNQINPLYSYVGEDYLIRVPTGILDIMLEGRHLNHCVGGSNRYLDRIERRESYVLFLRRTSDPEQSYYTLEVEPDGTVRQKRTMFDRQEADIEQAKDFLREWQEVISKRLTSEDITLAVRSKELRQQEFRQLKKDNVILYTRGFYGRPLLDVLMEDLMENTNVAAEPVLAAAA